MAIIFSATAEIAFDHPKHNDGVVALAPLVAKKALELSEQQKASNGDHYVDGCSFGSRTQLLTVCTFQPQICLGAFLADPQGFFDLLTTCTRFFHPAIEFRATFPDPNR